MITPLGSRYELIEPIASGATGTVWRARVRETGELVAAKEIKAELATDADVVDRFLRERRVLASIQHPAVVRLRDLVVEGERIGLVMDLVEGTDLRATLAADGPQDPGAALLLAATVADGLGAAHEAGVVHADVKPANVLVPTDGGPVRLADFGVARLVRGPAPLSYGTPEYIAPEVVLGHASIPASDVYGLGIMLYELLTGSTPYRGGSSAEVMQRHVTARPIWTPGVPEELRPLLASCLHRDPNRRPTADSLAAELRALTPGLTGHGAASPLSPGTPHYRLLPAADNQATQVQPDDSVTSQLPASPPVSGAGALGPTTEGLVSATGTEEATPTSPRPTKMLPAVPPNPTLPFPVPEAPQPVSAPYAAYLAPLSPQPAPPVTGAPPATQVPPVTPAPPVPRAAPALQAVRAPQAAAALRAPRPQRSAPGQTPTAGPPAAFHPGPNPPTPPRPGPFAPAHPGPYAGVAPGHGPAANFPPPAWGSPRLAAAPRAPRRWPLVISLSAACLLAVLLVGVGLIGSGLLTPHDRSADAGQSTRPITSASSDSPRSQNAPAPETNPTSKPTTDGRSALPPMFSPRPGDPSIGAPIG